MVQLPAQILPPARSFYPSATENYVVDVRNEIKSRFGEDHPALQVVGFDVETWTQINQPIHDRVEDRLQNRPLINPDAIVERAETLLFQ